MSSRIKADVKKLFEFWCEVALVHNADKRNTPTGGSHTSSPPCVVVESFPEGYRDEKTMADIPAFAFPCKIERSMQYQLIVTSTCQFLLQMHSITQKICKIQRIREPNNPGELQILTSKDFASKNL
ncbi:uncharacterized protein LOC118743913 [Rhagoletis pomonella]|uniref:uncharacterized protein LOC118743913 n=1 Tax=Rhagoletis pomonella TaxID=28610 RepID=UPI001787443E|nr:uncharacterized protein LOC118743913 [Rhagoletis pomonella]